MQKELKEFNDNQRNWIKNGEVFMLQLLDKTIGVPIAVYYLSQSSDAADVEKRVFPVLHYTTSCSNCLKAAKDTKHQPYCDTFCKDCFVNKTPPGSVIYVDVSVVPSYCSKETIT